MIALVVGVAHETGKHVAQQALYQKRPEIIYLSHSHLIPNLNNTFYLMRDCVLPLHKKNQKCTL